jgi:methylated-DNA-[protein]-cysteine S-methyltransferase
MTTSIENEIAGAAAALPQAGPSAAEMERFARRAARAGLIEVAYTQVDSPLGPLTLALTAYGLVTLAYPERSLDGVLTQLADEISPRVVEAPAKLDKVARELDQYFRGKRERFDTPIDWSLSRGFFRKVLEATAKIGYGEVSTYAGVAAAAGSPKAVRAAGNGLGSNPLPVVVPCHRVLRSGGALGGYTGGLERKEFLLDLERR